MNSHLRSPTGGLKLIVNADDFGLSEKVNEGIVQAHLHGILTSTSLMANGVAFGHAIKLIREFPSLDVGVHLTLVEEGPIVDMVPSLINGGRKFYPHATQFVGRYMANKVCLKQVQKELDAQIQKVFDHGVKISHLDSHQHLHLLPGIFRIVEKLAKAYGIKAIRILKEPFRPYMVQSTQRFTRIIQLMILNRFAQLCGKTDLQQCDNFAGFYFGGQLNKSNLMTVLESLPQNGTCELMCHPGILDLNDRYKYWGYSKNEEFAALTEPSIREWIARHNVQLTSFSQLAHS
jgi:hopanoid biosynthesis associated protein HpnK